MLGVVAGAAWLRYRGASPTAVTLRHARVLIAGNPDIDACFPSSHAAILSIAGTRMSASRAWW
ncbi:protein of unknown function [Cupriavidus taiwanensis]|uniref:Uncharacterized protein n=1 Tax=Cupriavidus taiwanensis TaxID=164546 RepID=A0A375IBG3_9BURK|nr:protein of unknown function [Cupriavidus taiwanensis]